jgi:hypothetical protein
MPRLFEDTVSAMCYEIAGTVAGPRSCENLPPYNDVTAFVLGQWQRMPRFWAWGVRLATLAFAFRAVFNGGEVFHRLAPYRRTALIDLWRRSSIGPCRDLIRFYRSLTILALYSREGAGQ